MSDPAISTPPAPPSSTSGALAIASFVLGLVALFTGLLLIGGITGLIGLVLGIIHLKRHRSHRAFAGWGIGLSLGGMALSLAVILLIWFYIRPFFAAMEGGGESFDPSEWIGKPMPEMTLTALDGKTIRTADWKGQAVVVDMWASWHPACTSAVAEFTRLAAEAATQGVHIVALSYEDAADLAAYATNTAIPYPIVATTNLPPPFGKVDSIPTTFFINPDGLIRDIRNGYEGYDALKQAALDRSAPVAVKHDDEDNKED